ncbi:unnamed protein product [Chrysoparadoxa australica]
MDAFAAALASFSASGPAPPPVLEPAAVQEMETSSDVGPNEAHLGWARAAEALRKERGRGRHRDKSQRKRKVIGLLLLVIDSLPHEAIWREWMDKVPDVEVRTWIHAKHPERVGSEWVKANMIPVSYCPAWGSVEITRAMIELLYRGLQCNDVGRFIFASETCIPLLPLEQCAHLLWKNEHSWVNYRFQPDNGYDTQLKWNKMSKLVPPEHISKSDQWVSLTRDHAENIIELPCRYGVEGWRLMQQVQASDEMYMPTMLSLIGAMKKEQVDKRRLTWCEWGSSGRSPATFTSWDPEQGSWTKVAEEGCLLGRKFDATAVTLEQWVVWRNTRKAEFDKQRKEEQEALDAVEEESDRNGVSGRSSNGKKGRGNRSHRRRSRSPSPRSSYQEQRRSHSPSPSSRRKRGRNRDRDRRHSQRSHSPSPRSKRHRNGSAGDDSKKALSSKEEDIKRIWGIDPVAIGGLAAALDRRIEDIPALPAASGSKGSRNTQGKSAG